MQNKGVGSSGVSRSGAASSASRPTRARGEFLDKTAEAQAACGPMSVANFMMPGRKGGAESPTARPSSRGARDPTAGVRPASRGRREAGVDGERPDTRSGREQGGRVDRGDASDGRPGTRSGRAPATGSILSSEGWGDMFAAGGSPNSEGSPAAEGHPTTRKGVASRATVPTATGKPKSKGTQPKREGVRASERGGKASAVAKDGNSDEEMERLLSDLDGSGPENEDSDFEQFLLTGESPALDAKPVKPKKKGLQPALGGDRPESRSGRKHREKGERKHRSEEEKEAKRAEIIDHCLERMVRDAEKEVSENSAAYYGIGIFRKKSLKEATAALSAVFDDAWAAIDLEMKLAAIEQMELSSEADADVWLRERLKGHDWQHRMRQELQGEGISMEADFAGLSAKAMTAVPIQRMAKDSDDELDDEAVLRMMPLMQDPLDALIAERQHAPGSTLPTPQTTPGEQMSVEKLAARSGHKLNSSMAHHGLRRLRN